MAIKKMGLGELSATVLTYYERYAMTSIQDEIVKKLDKIAKEMAKEVMDKYEIRSHYVEKVKEIDSRGEMILTIILKPKEK